MNKVFPKPHLTPYEADYAQWCVEQAALLRKGQLDQLDRENLAEEIETLGRSERREIGSRLSEILTHLLKWQYQPEKRKGGWEAEIIEHRLQLAALLADNPSLRRYPSEVLAIQYDYARRKAVAHTGLNISVFPAIAPYTIEQILDPDFLPES